MLSERYARDLPRLLVPRPAYHPFPTADERARWEALPPALRESAIREAEPLLGYHYPPLPATLYMDIKHTGERRPYEDPYFARREALALLVIGECLEGGGRFLDDIVNGLWAICEESTWVIPAHNEQQGGPEDALPEMLDPYIDLFAGETGALLGWTHYLLKPHLEAISRHLCPRLTREVKTRLLDPFLAHDDFWWMGREVGAHWLNNWSPWCASTCLSAFLQLEENEERRFAAVVKAMDILGRWLSTYGPDGGCDEGPSYWTVAGGALFDCLELLFSATHGRINVYDDPLVQEIGRYIYRAHIADDYYLDFADCPAKVHLPADLVYRYGRRIGDERMAALGAWAYQKSGARYQRGGSLLRALPGFFFAEGIEAPAQPPCVRDVWLDGIQVMAAREQEGSDRGLYLAAKGGHNQESHNHNDVGQFVVYCDGQPVLVDVGVGTYTRQTFSPRRYELWTMQSAYHNLPTVNGVQQHEGRAFRAEAVSYRADDAMAEITMDLAAAYPADAGIASWQQTCRLVRGPRARVELEEVFALARETQDVMFSLMTPCEPTLKADGIVLPCAGGAAKLTYDRALRAEVEPIPLHDARLRNSWGERLYRIVLRPSAPVKQAAWKLRLEHAAA